MPSLAGEYDYNHRFTYFLLIEGLAYRKNSAATLSYKPKLSIFMSVF
jgi:hypothetical protein